MSQERLAVEWFDRNATEISESYNVTHTPHGATERISYDVPKEKLARLHLLASICRESDATTEDRVFAEWTLTKTEPVISTPILNATFRADNDNDSRHCSITLLPETTLKATTYDGSTGGSVHYRLGCYGVEFDPYPLEFPVFPTSLPKPDIQQPKNVFDQIGEWLKNIGR